MKVAMTLLVRDEEDIIGDNLDFHLAQGVDHILIMDNRSVDATRDRILPYVERGVASYTFQPADDYAQGVWVTRLAREAARHGADWVINSDADEFWMAADPTRTLREVLADLPATTTAVSVPRFDCEPVAVAAAGRCVDRMVWRQRESRNGLGDPLPAKVCHRGCLEIEVDQGNHAVRRGGQPLATGPGNLRILHYPLRSYRQFENKIVKGGAAYARNVTLPTEVGATWRHLHQLWQEGGLPAFYRQHVRTPQELTERQNRGELIHDDTVARVLAGLR